MQQTLIKLKQHPVLLVNIIFTFLSIFAPLSKSILIAWAGVWIIVPILLSTDKAFYCLTYMSLYMRILLNIKLFAVIVCVSFIIILIKEILFLNKNKLLNKYFKIIIFYSAMLVMCLFYSVFVNKGLNIQFVYYLNMINLLLIIYLLKNKINYQTVLTYSCGIIISSIISLIMFYGGLYEYAYDFGTRFCAFMQLCNTLGVVCVLSIGSLYVLMYNGKVDKKIAWLLIGLLAIVGGATLSKNFAVTFVITLIFILSNEIRCSSNRKKVLKYLLIAIVVFSPIIIYYGLTMYERFFCDTVYSNVIDNITTGRLEKWLIYLKPWCKRFWSIVFGLGLGFDYGTLNSSHSLYVGYLSRLGVVGLVALVMFICVVVIKNNQSKLKLKFLPLILLCIICIAEDLSFNTFNFIPFIVAVIPTMVSDNTK